MEQNKKAGTIGNVGTTSFFPSKNLGCYGDGGAIFTNDDELAHTLRGIVNHGMYKRYYHDVVGVNSRLDSIQAGVLKAKLPLLDAYCEARRNAARFYNNAFANNPNIITPTLVLVDQFVILAIAMFFINIHYKLPMENEMNYTNIY